MADHIQVSIGCHARMFDLRPSNPVAIEEINDMDELMDCDKYVETGFKLMSTDETA